MQSSCGTNQWHRRPNNESPEHAPIRFGLESINDSSHAGLLFSSYFAGILFALIYSAWILLRVVKNNRGSSRSAKWTNASIISLRRNLNLLFSSAVILAAACFANEILSVCHTYMVGRFTDASPAYAIIQAWQTTQCLVCLLIILQVIRWRSLAALETHSVNTNPTCGVNR